MTPRQQADRLYQRVMSAAENGHADSAQFFGVMAIQTFQRLETLDPEARYAVGMIYLILGQGDAALEQVDALRADVPRHLLATMLQHYVAAARTDSTEMVTTFQSFLDDYDHEVAAERPEYERHRSAITTFRGDALRMTSRRGG